MARLLRLSLLLCLLVPAGPLLFTQGSRGLIQGTARDLNGYVLEGSQVTVAKTTTNVTRRSTTNSDTFAVNQTNQALTLPIPGSGVPVEQRLDDLLGRMTLEEKVRQLDLYAGFQTREHKHAGRSHVAADAAFLTDKAQGMWGNLGVGGIHDLYPTPEQSNAIQSWVIARNRLGIPGSFRSPPGGPGAECQSETFSAASRALARVGAAVDDAAQE